MRIADSGRLLGLYNDNDNADNADNDTNSYNVNLPDIATLPGVVSLYFVVSDRLNADIKFLTSGTTNTFQGRLLCDQYSDGGGPAVYTFHSNDKLVVDHQDAEEGDTFELKSHLGIKKWIVKGHCAIERAIYGKNDNDPESDSSD